MANISRPQILEGQSTHRPPLFTGSDYGYWKTRLTLILSLKTTMFGESLQMALIFPQKLWSEQP